MYKSGTAHRFHKELLNYFKLLPCVPHSVMHMSGDSMVYDVCEAFGMKVSYGIQIQQEHIFESLLASRLCTSFSKYAQEQIMLDFTCIPLSYSCMHRDVKIF